MKTSAASRTSWRSVAVALLLAALVPTLAAQNPSGGTGRIDGAVSDSKGKALAGTTVTLSSTTSPLRRTETTDKKGNYRFADVPAGEYTLTAELPEFVKAERIAAVAENKKAEVRFFLSSISTVAPPAGDAPRPVLTNIGR